MTDTDMANEQALSSSSPSSERKPEEENGIEWRRWLAAGDSDGSENYRTVSEAVVTQVIID
ncbi:conserved hypothetical protein [Ricinus communis]|uniref:Uncharacterized protein n=1 Tax=Ricinus communis TaxID=3988 RepID=B9SEA0_RICCO|nr:conserved hypothetical protein [Ricinus communis]